MPSHFLPRIASQMKFLLGTILQRELRDPRVGLVTVLKVEPTVDMKEAKVYISIFGSAGDQSKAMHALEDARGFIQRELGKNLKTRSTPRLRFILDDTGDRVSRIEALVEQAREDREKSHGQENQDSQEGQEGQPSAPDRLAPW